MLALMLLVVMRDGVSRDGYDAITIGMHIDEVMVVVNRPATVLKSGHVWTSGNVNLSAVFDAQQRLICCQLIVQDGQTGTVYLFKDKQFADR